MEKIHKREIKRLFPILEAIKEGKTIQWNDMGMWRDIDGDDEGFFLDTLVKESDNYRIKPEPKYRPFVNTEECWTEMLRHEPFGWVINKKYNTRHSVTKVEYDGSVIISYEDNRTRKGAFDDFTFADGLPFGVKVKEG